MERTMGLPQRPDGPYDFSYIDKYGVRITMCYDVIRAQTPEQLALSLIHISIMGVGAARRLGNVNWNVVKDLVLTWVCTFPGCGLLGFGMAKLFLALFG